MVGHCFLRDFGGATFPTVQRWSFLAYAILLIDFVCGCDGATGLINFIGGLLLNRRVFTKLVEINIIELYLFFLLEIIFVVVFDLSPALVLEIIFILVNN